ncbi:hemicentin-1-like [Melanotaenia boesemani]|uniref:hemicentin-1-like n=1 Tax=Melanotaenia boesemani TaxID=1250792 RepID=UPI001C050C01|nr:hemicentin-1-like [Melanotaenia boesemani]
MNTSSEVTASDRVHLSDGNATLTIINLTRDDLGPFRCFVFNPVSNGTSDPVNFTIIYGPDNLALTVNGLDITSFSVGSNLTMLCSVESNPPAQLQWAFRGKPLNRTGTLLELLHVSEDQSGPYSCSAFNNYTNTHSNITTHIMILKSGSEQQAVNVLLLLTGFLLSLPDLANFICIKRTEVIRVLWQTVLADLNYSSPFDEKEILIKMKSRMEFPTLFVLILSTITFADIVHSQNIYASNNPVAVGSNVTIFSQVIFEMGTWRLNKKLIVFKFPGGYVVSNKWKDRVTFNLTTEALTITSVTMNDSGVYELEEVNGFQEEFSLTVQVPVSNVTVWVKETNLVEFNGTAVLVCSASQGTSLSYKWLKRNSTISDGEEQLKSENTTLTIVNVTRYDQGPYRCNVSNGVGHEISPSVYLNISYGPSNTAIMAMPAENMYRTGSNITLSCSTESNPPAMVQWMFNDVYLNQNGPQLQLENVTLSHSGNYTCMVQNSVTLRFDNASTVIQVMDPLTTVLMRTSGPAILHKSFTLQCEVPDTVHSIQWFKDDQLISADNTTIFGLDNKTLTLNPVQHSHSGPHHCQAFNLVSNMTSSRYAVIVNYGPHIPTIMGPNVGKTGDSVTLRCHAESSPQSQYKWYFNGSEVSNMPNFTTPPLTKESSGEYICMAFNDITNKSSTAYKIITVVDPIENVQVETQMNPAIEGHPYNLTCNITGPADHIYWMKDWEILQMDNRTVFNMDNSTITFMSMKLSDTGAYQCVASSALGNMTSDPYKLVVNYGPDMPTIMGPNVGKTGDSVTLRCHAESSPPSQYKWYFNGSEVSNMSNFTTPPLTKESSGEYICMAFNDITNKNSTAYIMITVVDPIENVQVEPQMNPAIEGHQYYLTCNVTGAADHIYWMKDWEILQMDNRTVYNMDNSTITFMSMKRSDAGDYQCMAKNVLGNMISDPFKLVVNYPIENVQVEPQMNPAIEGHPYNLTCSVTGPADRIYWMKDWEILQMDNRTVFNMDNSMIMFMSVERSDAGDYKCMAKNALGNMTSAPFKLVVNFGPKAAMIDGPAFAERGSYISFKCSAVSVPLSYFSWWFKPNGTGHYDTQHIYMGKMVGNTSVFTVGPLSLNMSGEYICMVYNPVTRTNITNSTVLTVIEAIKSVMILSNTTPINNQNFTLTCHVVGPYEMIYWLKGGIDLNMSVCDPDLHKWCHTEKNMLHFSTLKLQSNGSYQCVAANKAAHHKSPKYNLLVNYGPLSVHISGPDSGKKGTTVNQTCTADSWPKSNFQWFFNNKLVDLKGGPVITFSATKQNEGKYTCGATNPITKITMYTSKTFTVLSHASAIHVSTQEGLIAMGLLAFSAHVLFN